MTNNKQQTAVEWLYNELLNSEPNILEWNKLLEQAKEIEKQQIMNAYGDGRISVIAVTRVTSKQYYEQTYEV